MHIGAPAGARWRAHSRVCCQPSVCGAHCFPCCHPPAGACGGHGRRQRRTRGDTVMRVCVCVHACLCKVQFAMLSLYPVMRCCSWWPWQKTRAHARWVCMHMHACICKVCAWRGHTVCIHEFRCSPDRHVCTGPDHAHQKSKYTHAHVFVLHHCRC